MQPRRAVGRGSASRKYDLLTILGVHALSQGKTLQRQTLRLICLITARYNWQNDQLSVGQAEIARLWSVDTRTVKREMAVFRDRGWLVERRAAARGRVTLYGLGLERILEDTRPAWERVGPDLTERLGMAPEPPAPDSKVIPFPQVRAAEDGSVWSRISAVLIAQDANQFRAWFASASAEVTGDELILHTQGAFHATYLRTHLMGRLSEAMRRVAPELRLRVEEG